MTIAKITEWDIKVLLSKKDEECLKDFQMKSKLECEKIKRPIFTTKDKDLLSKLKKINKSSNLLTSPRIFEKDKNKNVNERNRICLDLDNIISLYNAFHNEDRKQNQGRNFHEVLEASELRVPENKIIPRNPQLEERCKKLRMEQENIEYANMTKNVDSSRKSLPEDTISYQIKSLNKQLIAIFQFVVSVVTGFAFGFIGLELIFGGMEFGFRLLLGIICALIIALAEIYFLAKKLSEYDEFIDSPKHSYITASKKNN